MNPAVSFYGDYHIRSAGTTVDGTEISHTKSSYKDQQEILEERRPLRHPSITTPGSIEITSATVERWGEGFDRGSILHYYEIDRLMLGPTLRFKISVNRRRHDCYLYSEDDLFVSICEDNNVSSFGNTPGDAQERLREALELFYE